MMHAADGPDGSRGSARVGARDRDRLQLKRLSSGSSGQVVSMREC